MKLVVAALMALALVPAAAQAADLPCYRTDPASAKPCTITRPLVAMAVSSTPRPNVPVGLTASSPGLGVGYAWDLDGDGAFDDATGASVAPDVRGPARTSCAVRATDAFGRTGTEESGSLVLGCKSRRTLCPRRSRSGLRPGLEDLKVHTTFHAMAADADGSGCEVRVGSRRRRHGMRRQRARTAWIGLGRALLARQGRHVPHRPVPRVLRARVTDDRGATTVAASTLLIIENVPVAFLSAYARDGGDAPVDDRPVIIGGGRHAPGGQSTSSISTGTARTRPTRARRARSSRRFPQGRVRSACASPMSRKTR